MAEQDTAAQKAADQDADTRAVYPGSLVREHYSPRNPSKARSSRTCRSRYRSMPASVLSRTSMTWSRNFQRHVEEQGRRAAPVRPRAGIRRHLSHRTRSRRAASPLPAHRMPAHALFPFHSPDHLRRIPRRGLPSAQHRQYRFHQPLPPDARPARGSDQGRRRERLPESELGRR